MAACWKRVIVKILGHWVRKAEEEIQKEDQKTMEAVRDRTDRPKSRGKTAGTRRLAIFGLFLGLSCLFLPVQAGAQGGPWLVCDEPDPALGTIPEWYEIEGLPWLDTCGQTGDQPCQWPATSAWVLGEQRDNILYVDLSGTPPDIEWTVRARACETWNGCSGWSASVNFTRPVEGCTVPFIEIIGQQ